MVIIQGKGIELLKALIKLHQDNKLELSVEVMTRLNGRLVELLQPELFLNETVGHDFSYLSFVAHLGSPRSSANI